MVQFRMSKSGETRELLTIMSSTCQLVSDVLKETQALSNSLETNMRRNYT